MVCPLGGTMTTTEIVSSSGDGYVYGKATNSYSTARSTSTNFDITSTYHRLGQWSQDMGLSGYDFWVRRIFLKFDTSSIPTFAVISSVKLRLTAQADSSSTDFDVQIVKQNWTSQDPITAGTCEAVYDGCLAGTADSNIWRNTSGMSLNTPYESGELDTTWVEKGGTTYYSLRSGLDYSNASPSGSLSENESITIYTSEVATSTYRPYLVVTYTQNYRKLLMTVHAH